MFFLRYRGYSHDEGEASVSIRMRNVFNPEGQISEVIAAWDIQGVLQADTAAALTTKIRQLEAAYAVPDGNLELLQTGGGSTAHRLLMADWDYIRPTEIAYPVGNGGEYTTYRSYALSVEARRVPTSSQGGSPIVEYTETIEIQGVGGPDWGYHPVVAGNWPAYQLTERTPITVVQSGTAVGLRGYIAAPQPMVPAQEMTKLRRIVRTGPRVRVPEPREFPVQWSYTMQFMGGLPSIRDPGF